MCEPVTIAYAAATVASGLYAANQQKEMGEYNAAVARNQAVAQRQQAQAQQERLNAQADDVEARGREAERQRRIQMAQEIGAQRAAFAGSGVEVGGDTPMGVLQDTAEANERDALTIRANAAREAWGIRTQSQDVGYQGEQAALRSESDARLQRSRGRSQAFGTILSTATKTSGQMVRAKRVGAI